MNEQQKSTKMKPANRYIDNLLKDNVNIEK